MNKNSSTNTKRTPSGGNVARVYETLKIKASRFEFRPGEKLNETVVARSLGTSRTPLREALNRLVAEGFLTFETGKGFYCRSLKPQEIFDLYECREALETSGLLKAMERSNRSDLQALQEDLMKTRDHYHVGTPVEQLVSYDEAFHLKLAELSGNSELVRMLNNINGRIRFVRTLDLEERLVVTIEDHLNILDAMIKGDKSDARKFLVAHISKGREEATQAVQRAYVRLYVA